MKTAQDPKKNDVIIDNDEIPEELYFDYSKARPNRFVERYRESNPLVVIIEPDIAEFFTTSEEVNKVLRAIIEAMPKLPKTNTYAVTEK